MKIIYYILLILTFNIKAYSQESKIPQLNKYYQEIKHYLAPAPTNYKRELIFYSFPPFVESEYSVALETMGKTPILVLRSFKSSYWALFLSKHNSNKEMMNTETITLEKTVSKSFEGKFQEAFQNVVREDPSIFIDSLQIDDGNTYFLVNDKFRREFHQSSFSKTKNYRELVLICSGIGNDLRNGNFNENNYVDQINKLLKGDLK
jgi:hypothetical protein